MQDLIKVAVGVEETMEVSHRGSQDFEEVG